MNKFTANRASLVLITALICAVGGTAVVPVIARAVADQQTEPNMTFTEKNNGQTVEAKVGDIFEVRLVSNASTGYSWNVTAQDTEALESDGEPKYVRPEKPMPGAPGKQVFRFKVKRAGETKLELAYKRPWEKDTPPAQTFALTLSIVEADK